MTTPLSQNQLNAGVSPGIPDGISSTKKARSESPIAVSQRGNDVSREKDREFDTGGVPLDELVSTVNQQFSSRGEQLHISIDNTTGDAVISIIDKNSGRVVAQVPSELSQRLGRNLDPLSGVLLDQYT